MPIFGEGVFMWKFRHSWCDYLTQQILHINIHVYNLARGINYYNEARRLAEARLKGMGNKNLRGITDE